MTILFRMAPCNDLLTGTHPFSPHFDIFDALVFGTNRFLKSTSFDFNVLHNSSTVLFCPELKYSSFHLISTSWFFMALKSALYHRQISLLILNSPGRSET